MSTSSAPSATPSGPMTSSHGAAAGPSTAMTLGPRRFCSATSGSTPSSTSPVETGYRGSALYVTEQVERQGRAPRELAAAERLARGWLVVLGEPRARDKLEGHAPQLV